MDLRERVKVVALRWSEAQWELAEILERIQREGLYFQWGHATWRAYLEAELPDVGVRQVQYIMQVWRWQRELPEAAQTWIRSISFSKARRLMGLVDAQNWQEWRDRSSEMSTQMLEAIRRERSCASREELMDLRERRVWEATRGLGLSPVQHMALMRSLGVSAEHVAILFGVEVEEVRSQLRLVQVFLPATTVERAATYASQDGRPPDAEICLVLQQVYDETMPQLGEWGCPAISA